MMEPANRITIPRQRKAWAIDRAIVDTWINPNCEPGGIFGSQSHALERAIARLRTEHEFINDKCKQEGVPFHASAFWNLYLIDLESSARDSAGAPAKNETRIARRVSLWAFVAVELLEWAEATCVEDGPFATLSQVIEAGLLRLRAGSWPLKVGDPEPSLTAEPGLFWKEYLQHVKPKAKAKSGIPN